MQGAASRRAEKSPNGTVRTEDGLRLAHHTRDVAGRLLFRPFPTFQEGAQAMAGINRTMALRGTVQARHRGCAKAPWSWRVRNFIIRRLPDLPRLAVALCARAMGVPVVISVLRARVRTAAGEWIDYGVLSTRVVTTAGVGFLVDAWQNSVELENMKYHGVGTGTNAEGSGDTALQTESTTAIDPNSTRATGSTTEGASANIFRSVGTVTFDDTAAITEHGLFSQAATGGGVLWDRSVFSAINVVSGDSIQFTYDVTFTAGS
jgi:hypothetical protein